jgi:uncharacterized protein YbcI
MWCHPEWAPLEFSKTILKLENERFFKRDSKVDFEIESFEMVQSLDWVRTPLDMAPTEWAPYRSFEKFEINTENDFEKGLKSIIEIQNFWK